MPVGTEFEVERTNSLDELCIATPSIAQGKLLIRTASQVYCLSNVKE
jgi:outer membrane protein assembly factor BamB